MVLAIGALVAGCGTMGSGPVGVDEFFTVPAGEDVGLVATDGGPAVAAKVRVDVTAIEEVPDTVTDLLPDEVSAWLVFGAERGSGGPTNASVRVK
jgi:hypothetical protein